MSKWLNQIVKPTVAPEPTDHIAVEDLARLADGTVGKAERQHFMRHINRCQRCFEILEGTLADLATDTSEQPTSSSWWKARTAYALAASIILAFLIGGQFVFKYWSQHPQVILATLNLDQELKDILLEDDALQWGKGNRMNRLMAALDQKGLQVKELNLVVLSKPYYQKKSLFGPKEVLQIRIENKVAYLQVKELAPSQ
jgi:hypothetical protein